MYIFDTSSFKELFRFYPKRFPSLWDAYNNLLNNNKIVSVKEVLKEIVERGDSLNSWAEENKHIFHEPTIEEAKFMSEIFRVKNFQHSMEQRKLLKGGAFADPFVVAKAKTSNGTVVTQEAKKPNAAKIPNICHHFKINCINLEAFMEKENWEF